MVHKIERKATKRKGRGIHKAGKHKIDVVNPPPEKGAFWTLGIPRLGDIHFKTFAGGMFGKKFISKPTEKAQLFCPDHPNTRVVYVPSKYKCPKDGKEYSYNQVLRAVKIDGKTEKLTPVQIRERFPRTVYGQATKIVPFKEINPDQFNTNMSYYLVPINTYENVLRYNQLVDMLEDGKYALLTEDMRVTAGIKKHRFIIFPSKAKKCLMMVEYIPKTWLNEVPTEAKFKPRLLTQELKREVEKAKKLLLKTRR